MGDNGLERYGKKLDAGLEMRMKWHAISQVLLSIQWYHSKSRLEERNQLIEKLAKILAS